MYISEKALEAAARAYASGYDSYPRPAQRDIEEVVIAILEAAAPFIAAKELRDAANDWASNPEPWGDNEKDYRNELLDRADELEAGK